MSLLVSVNHAFTLAQRLREITKNIEDAEFKNVLADLCMELADAKLAIADVTEENAKLKSELTKLRHSTGASASELEFKEFAYFNGEGDGPFCPGCYDSSKTKIRLKKETGHFKVFGANSCPKCKEHFG